MRTIGRYALHDEIASGGMGTVHLGRLLGEAGFSRPVAIKRLHPHLARQEEFRRMFIDEARLAARVRHPNVLATIDVVTDRGASEASNEDELFVVMEYVHGAPLSYLLQQTVKAGRQVPLRIASSIAVGMLLGLHAAHEATDERGRPLGIVHRDVSPQNVIVGADGQTRVLDFGVAKARGRLQASTGEGFIKGKLGYLAPEQIRGKEVTRLNDLWAAAVVIWELLTAKRLFPGDNEGHVLEQILVGWVDPPSKWVPSLPEELDKTLLRALDLDPSKRIQSARELAMAIERCVPVAPAVEVGEWVERTAFEVLEERARALAQIDHDASPPSGAHRIAGAAPQRRAEDPSTISVARKTSAHAGASRKRAAIALAALAMVGVASAFFVVRHRERTTTTAAPSSQPSTAPIAPFSVDPQATSSPPSVEELAPDPPAPNGPSGPGKPHKAPKPKTTPSSTSTSPPTAAPPPVASGNADCTPPWTWDALGRRIYKRHCLHLAAP